MRYILITLLFLCIALVVKSQNDDIVRDDGKHVIYYKTGNVKAQGNYLNNKREGEWLYYYNNGKMALRKNFYKGKEIGEWAYYNEEGNLIFKVDDISKIQEKVEVTLYENNKVKSKSTFVNGKKVDNSINDNQVELKSKF